MRALRNCISGLLVLAFSVVSCYAADGGSMLLGVKGGVGLSSFWGNGIMDFEENAIAAPITGIDPAMLISPTAGAFASISIIPDFLTFQPEILFVRSGKLWDATAVGGSKTSFKIYTDYVMVPLLAKLLVPFAALIMPGAYLGPQMSLKLRAQATGLAQLPPGTNIGFAQSFAAQEDISDFVNFFDVGMATGIGFDFFVGPGSFVIDLRYTFGFLNVFDVTGAQDIRNSLFSIMGGYAIIF